MAKSSVCLFGLILSGCIASSLLFPTEQLLTDEDETCTSPPTFISNGHVTISDDGWRAEYSCREDFVLIGPIEVTCIGGSWSPNPPYCLGTGCDVLPAIEHGTIIYQYGGALAEVRCEEGHELRGAPLLTCHDHRWNGTTASCVKIGDETSEVSDTKDDVTALLHAANLAKSDYSCVTSEAGIPPPIVANAVAIPQWTLVEGTPRLYATYRCRWHHVIQGVTTSVYCQQGEWVGSLPECVPLVIDDRKTRLMDVDDVSSLSHEEALELADYSCADGVKMVDPPPVPNAYVTLQVFISGGMPHLFGEVSCRAGLQLAGSKYVYCVRGKWLGTTSIKCS